MKRVLLIADSHGSIKEMENVLSKEKDVNIKIHLGDSGAKEEWLKDNFDYYVTGNNDKIKLEKNEIIIKIEDMAIALTHGDNYEASFKEMFKYKERVSRAKLIKLCRDIHADAVFYGHSHIKDWTSTNSNSKSYTIVNPGSFSYPRDQRQKTYAIVSIEKNEIKSVEFKIVEDY